jgi:hypothetical protein
MRRYVGRLVGVVVGLTGGWYGVIVGLLIGTLFDHLLESHRRGKGVKEFLSTGRGPRLKAHRQELWTAAALATRLVNLTRPPTREQTRQVREYLGRHFDLRGSRLEDLMDLVALRPASLDEDALIHRWRELRGERLLWTEEVICWFYDLAGARKEGIAPEERGWIRRVAGKMGLTDEQLRIIEDEAPFLEEEAAQILGVPRSARREQVRRVYRRLASQFHPDTAVVLADEQRRSSEGAFVKIREAYERLMKHLDELDGR